MDRTGQIFEGRYRLQRLLGRGGMASVFAARDRKLGKPVAIKVLSPNYAAVPKTAQRFVQEARAVSRIQHPNVIDVTDFGVADDGAAYLVMELLRGEDLAATLRREGPLPWPRLGLIALQVCAALDVAHRAGIVHRDIKPSNCFRVHSPGNPDFIKVLDFGIAKVLDPRRSEVEPTTAGTILGTPEYMAPEVASGRVADARSDVYALGAMLYKLVTGTSLFTGESYMTVLAKQMFDAPEPPRQRAPGRDIPEAAEALLLRALAKDPAERFAGMAEFAAAIAPTLPGQPPVDLWISGATEATQSMTAGEPSGVSGGTGPGEAGSAERSPAPGRRLRPLALVGTLASAALAAWVGALALGFGEPDASASAEPDPPVLEDREAPAAAEAVPADRSAPSAAEPAAAAPKDAQPAWEGAAPSVPEDSAAPDGPRAAGAPKDMPRRIRGSAAAAPSDPRPPGEREARAPDFDAAAARQRLEQATPAIRGCAQDFSLHRGEIALRVTIDAGGEVRRVALVSGSRAVEAGAVACMRRAVERLRFEPVAGEVVHVYVI